MKKNKQPKSLQNMNSGFTLVEMILYIAIVAIFMTGLVYFTLDIVYGREKSYVHQEVNQNTRFAAKRIAYEIKNAKSIISPLSGSSSSISLEYADANRNPTVINISGDGRITIGYGSSGNCPTSSPCFLTGNKVNVTAINFTNLSSGDSTNIKFSMTIAGVGDAVENQKIENFETSVELRSK